MEYFIAILLIIVGIAIVWKLFSLIIRYIWWVVGLYAIIVAVLMYTDVRHYKSRQKPSFVLKCTMDSTGVYSGPHEGFAVLKYLNKGTTVDTTFAQTEGWIEVREGWVRKKNLKMSKVMPKIEGRKLFGSAISYRSGLLWILGVLVFVAIVISVFRSKNKQEP